jgi:cytochrome c553
MMQKPVVGLFVCLVFSSGIATADRATEWTWLFPTTNGQATASADNAAPYWVPGSKMIFTGAQIKDLKHAVDWFPDEHASMPMIVAESQNNSNACGYCHLPNGNGRPENSSLAGLSPDYIKRQVNAFANGTRQAAIASALPAKLMIASAKAASATDIDQAADYFSKLRFQSRVRVVETPELAFKPGRFVYILQAEPKQPIGERIVEVPVDPDRFELRDPHTRFIAFVPPGSISAGQAIAASGGPMGQPCTTCHGDGLRGGVAPPLAGRSPTMLMRQLISFQAGTRSAAEAAPMRDVTRRLDDGQMVALSAYAATLKP